MRDRRPGDRRREAAQGVGLGAGFNRRGFHLLRARMGDGHGARHALLQQQVAGHDHGLAVEARPHHPVIQNVGYGHDGHALMMGHVAAHHRHLGVLGQPRAGEIERLVESIGAARAHRREARVIRAGGLRVHHGRQPRRVGRDHKIVGEAAFEPESGHAEIRVLIGEFAVAGVIGGFRNAPRNAFHGPIGLLAPDHGPVRLLEQAAGRRAHHQRGHEIFEHGAGP